MASLSLAAPPMEGVVWGPREPAKESYPVFVSQDALQQMESFLSPEAAKEIRTGLETALRQVTPRQPCGSPRSFDATMTPGVKLKGWKSIKDKLASGWLIFRAHVVDFVPGWHVGMKQPAALVEIEVEEVLGGSGTQTKPGDRLHYFQQQGVELAFEEVVLCSYDKKGYRAVTGDEVVIAVSRPDSAAGNDLLSFGPDDIYLVKNGEVFVTWYLPGDAEESVRLETLRKP